jgi:serine/threonine protein kinase/tetratricopeptide (TPR) repeat protein
MPLAPGTRLGTYEIVGPLGAGGMGEVYRAKDLRLGREIALKVLPEAVGRDAEHLARFEREARTVAGLNHPNIVTLHSVEDEDDVRFLTMELVEGESLADLMRPGGLPLTRVLDTAIAIADALAAAHERGVVHRDLKPDNVMVTRDGRVKVLDFGLAKLATTMASADRTQAPTLGASLSETGMVAGTAPYMAPEQIRAEPVDARTDLFAFGILLYELLAGRRPFVGSNAMVVSAAILNQTPEPLSRVRTDLPGDLERVVSRCLEKNARERAQSALDVSNELRRLRRVLDHDGARKPRPDQIASIAVLPFVNRSASADDEYFSDGLADELLNVLAKIRGLRVAARASAFHFKGKDTTIAEVGGALNVATVLDGSVRRAGNRVRISVQLVKVSDGYHLWSETYDRTLEDMFAVQDEIARSVVNELRTTLVGEEVDSKASGQAKVEVANAARGRTTDPEAHRLALQGRHMIERLTRDDLMRGIEYLREALQKDPNYALAWVDLSRAHLSAAGHDWEPLNEGVAAARRAAERALSIEPDLSEGHVVLGRVRLYFDWDWEGAKESYRRAMDLAPGNAVGRHGAGVLAQSEGRTEEALSLYTRAVDQDPLSAAAYHRLGTAYLAAGRPSEAEAALRKSIELAPQRVVAHSSLAFALLAQGRLGEAREEAEREGEGVYRLLALTAIYLAEGRADDSDVALRALVEEGAANSAFQIAEAHAIRDEFDAAFEWLERARAQRDPGLAEINGSHLLRSLHGDPRWGALLRKMGFEV